MNRLNVAVAYLLVAIAQVLIATGDCKPSVDVTSPIAENNNTGDGLTLVSRSEWGAQQPVQPASPLETIPARYAIIHHTATEPCSTQAQCSRTAQIIQTFHMETNGFDDIAYNFLIGGDGKVYVGRGWDVQGAHSFHFNKNSIGIGFIGTFNTLKSTKEQLQAAQALLKFGAKNGKLAVDYKLLGGRQLARTMSPGDTLYEIIKTWPHWSADL